MHFIPERILVTDESWEDPAAHEMLARLPGIPLARISSAEEAAEILGRTPDPVSAGKRCLMLARRGGRFMNPCPGDGAEMCCNYRVLNLAANCPMDCTYCVLQSFLSNPAVVVFTNIEAALDEVRETLGGSPRQTYRIGTGDLGDSLALDHITHYSRRLVPLFARWQNAILELKTKSDEISNLEGLDHQGRTVVSWSVNSRRVLRGEEFRTAGLEMRIASARRCQAWGYRTGFHFDPLICYPGWEADYAEAVREIFEAVDPEGVAWVSLGGLRFTSQLRDVIRARFPKSGITYGEFVPGNHGKWRYFRPIREEMYAALSASIRHCAPGVPVYLCMENRAAWRRGMGGGPADAAALSDLLDQRV